MTQAELRKALKRAGRKRQAAKAAQRDAAEQLAEIVPTAVAAGIPTSEIASITGLSRQAVYDLLRRPQ